MSAFSHVASRTRVARNEGEDMNKNNSSIVKGLDIIGCASIAVCGTLLALANFAPQFEASAFMVVPRAFELGLLAWGLARVTDISSRIRTAPRAGDALRRSDAEQPAVVSDVVVPAEVMEAKRRAA